MASVRRRMRMEVGVVVGGESVEREGVGVGRRWVVVVRGMVEMRRRMTVQMTRRMLRMKGEVRMRRRRSGAGWMGEWCDEKGDLELEE